MTAANLITLAILIAIAAGALGCVFLFRRQTLNISLLALGACLLVYGHVQWVARNESPEVKEALFIRHIVAGWALAGMGYVGGQCRKHGDRDE